jgi:hypothetical protein
VSLVLVFSSHHATGATPPAGYEETGPAMVELAQADHVQPNGATAKSSIRDTRSGLRA